MPCCTCHINTQYYIVIINDWYKSDKEQNNLECHKFNIIGFTVWEHFFTISVHVNPEMKFILCTKHYHLIGMGHWGKQLIHEDCRNISKPGQLVSIFCGVVHKGVKFISIYWEKRRII